MKNKIFSLCIIVFLGLFSFLNNCFAVGTETTDTGLDVTYIQRNGLDGVVVQRWDAYPLGTSGTYVYNKYGSTTSNAGSIMVEGFDFKYASINITNTAADTITIRPEYRIGTTSFWINGSTTTFVGTQTGRLVEENPTTDIRWGAIKNGTNTADVTFFEVYVRYLRR